LEEKILDLWDCQKILFAILLTERNPFLRKFSFEKTKISFSHQSTMKKVLRKFLFIDSVETIGKKGKSLQFFVWL